MEHVSSTNKMNEKEKKQVKKQLITKIVQNLTIIIIIIIQMRLFPYMIYEAFYCID